ncbi:MAG: GreA/GreB family elongation factor [Planctomycetota bacterium]
MVAQDYLALVHSANSEALEAAWNAALGDPGEVTAYARTLAELAERGESGTAIDLGLRMIEALEKKGRAADAFELGVTIVGKQTNNESFSRRMFELLQRAFGSTDWLPIALDASGLSETNLVPTAFETFDRARRFTPGHVVYHRAGWGEGVIEELDITTRHLHIRFVSGSRKELPFKSALESLRPLERDDLRTMRLTRLEELVVLAEEQPATVIRMAVRVYRGSINSQQLKGELLPVITEKKWNGWWKRAKVAAGNDPWLQIDGTATRPVFVMRKTPVSFADEARKAFGHARNLPEVLGVGRDYLARGIDDEAQALILDLVQQRVEKDLQGSGESAARLLDGILFLEEHGRGTSVSAAQELRELLLSPDGLAPEAFDTLATQASREHAVRLLPEALGETWAEQCAAVITRFPISVIEHVVALMQEKRVADTLAPVWAVVAPYPRRYPVLTWLIAKLQAEGDFEDREDAPDTVSVCRVLLHLCRVIATDPRSDAGLSRVKQRVATLVTGRKGQLTRCVDSVSRDDLANFLGIAERGGQDFPQEITDAVLRVVAKRFPDITSKPERPFWDLDDVIFVTGEGLKRRREEHRVLVDEKIPANAKAINAAAALGDLSENSEWEAAMEEQRNLTGRAEDMTRELRRAKLIEDQEIPEGVAVPGTRVGITWLDDGTKVSYRLLGPWDCVEDDIINYKAPLGAAMLGHAPGDEVNFENQGTTRTFRVETVERVI